jgi:hypothetical protein
MSSGALALTTIRTVSPLTTSMVFAPPTTAPPSIWIRVTFGSDAWRSAESLPVSVCAEVVALDR